MSNICLFDGSYGPSVPWQTSTCKHAAAQAWIQSCFYKIQLLQECNICQFQRAALLHVHSSDATDPRRKVFNTCAVLHTNIHATNWLTMSCSTMFLDAVRNRSFRKLLFHDYTQKTLTSRSTSQAISTSLSRKLHFYPLRTNTQTHRLYRVDTYKWWIRKPQKYNNTKR